MNRIASFSWRPVALALAIGLGLGLVAEGAQAHPRGRVHFGVWVGGPLWWPGYWGPPAYYPRTIVVQPPAEPLVVAPSAAEQAQYWYYCRDSQMYYPHVRECASPWQEVPAKPESPR